MDERIRVLIVDDHTMVHIGLSTMLEAFEEFELVGLASNGEEALRLSQSLKPDVILMDIVMPGMSGIEATNAIIGKHPQIRVIALTSFEEADHVQAALDAGASGYLLKNVSATELAEAIKAARAGRVTLAPEAAQAMIEAARRPSAADYQLTERELEVLHYMAKGLSNGQIALQLVVSPFTVKSHVSNILSKLGA
ncbi:MAG: response regulator transcription factor, partial [Acidobacteriales bacterium]|nr:response regulator transcription factor [Terriglobales bacterium]